MSGRRTLSLVQQALSVPLVHANHARSFGLEQHANHAAICRLKHVVSMTRDGLSPNSVPDKRYTDRFGRQI